MSAPHGESIINSPPGPADHNRLTINRPCDEQVWFARHNTENG